MKSPLCTFLAASLLLTVASVCPGQNPVVENGISDITVPLGTAKTKVKFTNTFALARVTGPIVRFDTTEGPVDVGLLSGDAPATVNNFLNYVNRGAYAGTFIHRLLADVSTEGLAIIQGGGYTDLGGEFAKTSSHPPAFVATHIPTDPPVVNEFKNPNIQGTIAMAKTSDPNSATSEWFFNTADNSTALDDPNNSGGFTVFGRVLGNGLTTLNAIAALKRIEAYGLQSDDNTVAADFTTLPVRPSYVDPAAVYPNDLVTVRNISVIPLIAPSPGAPGVLKLKLKGNTNPALIRSAVLTGGKLKITFAPGATGTTNFTVMAKDSAKNKVLTTFSVTVE